MKKSDHQCWHGTYVESGTNGWVHSNSGTPCDDPAPMYKPQKS